MTTPTQNDIPSSTAIDVRFNAEKLDEVINSDNETYDDRFGVKRFTLKGIITSIQVFFDRLSSATGADNITLGLATISELFRPSIFRYMTKADRDTIKGTVGIEVNVDYALKAAIDDGLMELYFPPVKGIYVLGATPVTLPIGFALEGTCRRPYTVSADATFNNTGTVIRTAVGKTFPFYSVGRHLFRNINFDGRDKTGYLFYGLNSSVQFNGSRVEGCGLYRFSVALGWNYYTGTMFAFRCSMSGNGDAIKNLIDSNIIGCVMNANNRGVALLSGANNNSFIACRNEWNNNDNYYGYGAVQNIISGELCDRAGRGGVVAGAGASWYVSNSVVRRCGATQDITSRDSANFIIIDSGEIILSGVKTLKGVGDSGEGTNSPAYAVSMYGAGAGKFIASGCDLTGYNTQAYRNTNADLIVNIIGCNGTPNNCNTGLSKVNQGRYAPDVKTGNLSSTVGSTLVVTMENIPLSQYQIGLKRTLLVEVRTTNGKYEYLQIPFMTTYESSAVITINTAKIESSGATIGMDSSATGVKVALASDGVDNSTLTVTLTNVDGINVRQIRCTLLPV